jgi:hypothetical protein
MPKGTSPRIMMTSTDADTWTERGSRPGLSRATMGPASTMTSTMIGTLATRGIVRPVRKSRRRASSSPEAAAAEKRGKSAVMIETVTKACGSMKRVKATAYAAGPRTMSSSPSFSPAAVALLSAPWLMKKPSCEMARP